MDTKLISHLPDIHRELPQCLDTEKAILSIFIAHADETAAMLSERGINKTHFHVYANLFSGVMGLWKSGKPVNSFTLVAYLRDTGELDKAGGVSFILKMACDGNGISHSLPYYLDRLTEKALSRALILLGCQYAAGAYEANGDAIALAGGLIKEVSELLPRPADPQKSKKDILVQIIEEIRDGKEDESHFPVGIEGIDARLKLYSSDFLCIAGPTGSGKSSLASQIVLSYGLRGANCLVFPLEMSEKQVLKRMLADISGYNVDAVRFAMRGGGSAAMEKASAAAEAAGKIISSNLNIRKHCRSLDSIIAECRSAHSEKPLKVVLIDYIQLVQIDGNFGSRQQEIAHGTQSLKRMADELGCIVIVPSQVNAQGNAREAMDIENDANSVIKIQYDKENGGDRRVIIDKQREGESGVALNLGWNGALTRFENRNDEEAETGQPKKKGCNK